MSSIPHKELPVSQELLEEAMEEEEPEEIIEEIAEVKVCEEGCTLEKGHEGECVVEAEEIEVILKSTSMERDLKVKFVNKKTGKVISGADFKMKVTSPSKNTKEYSDHDNDGIIWVKDIDGGNYTVAMLDLEGYITAETLKAEVKKKIEYKVVEIEDEVKSESEIVVSEEDAAYGGTDKDESTSGSVVLTDTVKFVESRVDTSEESNGVQKKDAFGQPMYEKYLYENGQRVYKEQMRDELNQPMFAVILSESAEFHKDKDNDKVCDRCKASMQAACATHTDKDNNQKCDTCNSDVDATVHQHYEGTAADCICEGCKEAMHTVTNGICSVCNQMIDEKQHIHSEPLNEKGNCTSCNNHVKHVDDNTDEKCDTCEEELQKESAPQNSNVEDPVIAFVLRPFMFLRTANESIPAAASTNSGSYITYDTSSAKIYDPNSAPVYDTSSAEVYETEPVTTYYGWQTIDGATYYFDENGNKVTGHQVIQGVSYTFNSDGVRSGSIGIDVSKYQTGIEWTKIKKAGIDFVMIRCGYRGYGSGVLVEDEMYRSHITGAKAAGLRVGVYFFSQAINEAEAVEEASMAVKLANKYGINMPIAIDSEYANGGAGRADRLSKSARTAITKAFCNTVKNAGHTPMVYASKSWFSDHLNVSQLSGYRIWVAHYADKCGYTGTYHMWQHTDKGKVDGYSGYLDMNISSI